MPPTLRESIIRLHKTGTLQLALDSNEDLPRKQFYSCGSNDSIAKWVQKSADCFEPDVFACNNFCGNIAVNKDVFVGETVVNVLTDNEENVVNKYDSKTKIVFEILKFSMPVSALDVSPNGKFLIAGAKDYVLKMTKLNRDQEWYDKHDLDGIAVSISIDPFSEAVAVSTSDGRVTIYSIHDEGLKELKKFKLITPFNKIDYISSNHMHCAWHPYDPQLFLPSLDSIIVVNTKEWTKDNVIKSDSNKNEEFSILAISSNGQYLAGYTLESRIYVYQIAAFQLISKIDLKGKRIASMIFDPENDKNLILADSKGMMHMVDNATTLLIEDIEVKNKSSTDEMDFDPTFDNIDEDAGKSPKNTIVIDDEDDIGAIKSRYGFDSSARPTLSAPTLQIPPEILEQLKRPVCTIANMRPPHPFVSGSTPLRNGERFLKWNCYGQIRMFETDRGASTEIEFHDSSIHAEIIINDRKFLMGDLNDSIIALASDSEIYVRLISSFDLDNRVWTLQMPEGEVIENIAAGNDFVAVFTRERYIRVFTASGTQRAIFSVEAPVLTMAAHDNMLVLATVSGGMIVHSTEVFEHQLRLDMYEINALGGRLQVLKKLCSSSIALSPESSLKWLNFSSSGQVCIMDSDFVVRLLSPSSYWVPIFEGSTVLKNETNGFWPITVLDSGAHLTEPKIRYLNCKGSNFPLPSKNLVPATDGLCLPLCNKEATKTKDENELLLTEIMLSAKQLTSENITADREEMDKLVRKHLTTVVKLFGNAVMAKKENRAAEFIKITHGQSGVNKLCTFAAKISSKGLVDKLTKVAEQRFANDSDKPSSNSLYAHNDTTEASKRTFKRKTIDSISSTQQTDFDFGLKSSKIIRKSGKTQDIFVESQMETDEREPEISFSVLNDSSTVYSLNESRISVSSPCNPFKKNMESTQMTSTTSIADSEDFFSTLVSSARTTTTSETTNKSQTKKTKVTQSKLAFNGPKKSLSSKENVPNVVKPTAFDLWCKDNDDRLRNEFDGDDDKNFMNFAIQQFRAADKEEKEKYKEMATNFSVI